MLYYKIERKFQVHPPATSWYDTESLRNKLEIRSADKKQAETEYISFCLVDLLENNAHQTGFKGLWVQQEIVLSLTIKF